MTANTPPRVAVVTGGARGIGRAIGERFLRHGYYDAAPLARYGTTEEMADAVGFLCGDQSSFINGQVLAVDGGFDAAGVGLPALRQRITGGGQTPDRALPPQKGRRD
jgi:NAD(P)-dependent dehydrogenase (short-subunit alcohol dehydrogenase family)